MNKFGEWFSQNRLAIGYTVGILNILSGFLNIIVGNVVSGCFWLLIGATIVYDTRHFK